MDLDRGVESTAKVEGRAEPPLTAEVPRLPLGFELIVDRVDAIQPLGTRLGSHVRAWELEIESRAPGDDGARVDVLRDGLGKLKEARDRVNGELFDRARAAGLAWTDPSEGGADSLRRAWNHLAGESSEGSSKQAVFAGVRRGLAEDHRVVLGSRRCMEEARAALAHAAREHSELGRPAEARGVGEEFDWSAVCVGQEARLRSLSMAENLKLQVNSIEKEYLPESARVAIDIGRGVAGEILTALEGGRGTLTSFVHKHFGDLVGGYFEEWIDEVLERSGVAEFVRWFEVIPDRLCLAPHATKSPYAQRFVRLRMGGSEERRDVRVEVEWDWLLGATTRTYHWAGRMGPGEEGYFSCDRRGYLVSATAELSWRGGRTRIRIDGANEARERVGQDLENALQRALEHCGNDSTAELARLLERCDSNSPALRKWERYRSLAESVKTLDPAHTGFCGLDVEDEIRGMRGLLSEGSYGHCYDLEAREAIERAEDWLSRSREHGRVVAEAIEGAPNVMTAQELYLLHRRVVVAGEALEPAFCERHRGAAADAEAVLRAEIPRVLDPRARGRLLGLEIRALEDWYAETNGEEIVEALVPFAERVAAELGREVDRSEDLWGLLETCCSIGWLVEVERVRETAEFWNSLVDPSLARARSFAPGRQDKVEDALLLLLDIDRALRCMPLTNYRGALASMPEEPIGQVDEAVAAKDNFWASYKFLELSVKLSDSDSFEVLGDHAARWRGQLMGFMTEDVENCLEKERRKALTQRREGLVTFPRGDSIGSLLDVPSRSISTSVEALESPINVAQLRYFAESFDRQLRWETGANASLIRSLKKKRDEWVEGCGLYFEASMLLGRALRTVGDDEGSFTTAASPLTSAVRDIGRMEKALAEECIGTLARVRAAYAHCQASRGQTLLSKLRAAIEVQDPDKAQFAYNAWFQCVTDSADEVAKVEATAVKEVRLERAVPVAPDLAALRGQLSLILKEDVDATHRFLASQWNEFDRDLKGPLLRLVGDRR